MYFNSPGIILRKVPICLLQLHSPSKMNNTRSPPGFPHPQPQEETKRSSSPKSSSSGQDLNPWWVAYIPPATSLSTSPLPTPISGSVVLYFVFITMNTEVLRNYNNKMTQLQTYVLMSRRLATTQATRRGFFFLLHRAEPVFQGQMRFFLKLGKTLFAMTQQSHAQ